MHDAHRTFHARQVFQHLHIQYPFITHSPDDDTLSTNRNMLMQTRSTNVFYHRLNRLVLGMWLHNNYHVILKFIFIRQIVPSCRRCCSSF